MFLHSIKFIFETRKDMRRLYFTLFLVVFCVFDGVAQDNKSESGEKEIKPVITFEKNTHDFGKIEYNKGGTCSFIFRNTGEKPLIITAVWVSCGCSTPSWPVGTSYPAGQNKQFKGHSYVSVLV